MILSSFLSSFLFFPSSFRVPFLFLFLLFSLSFFRTTSRSLTAPLNTGTAIKANKSNERLVFSAVLQRNITEIYEIAKRRDLKIARDVLRGKAVETQRTRYCRKFHHYCFSKYTVSDYIVIVSTATLKYTLLCSHHSHSHSAFSSVLIY